MTSQNEGPALQLCIYTFGSATFDESAFDLRVGGVAIESQPLPLRLLQCLLRERERVVSKDRLSDEVWEGEVAGTSDASITNAVRKLRAALGENAHCIKTVSGKGYRFTGPVTEVPARPPARAWLDLAEGMAAPGREQFILTRKLSEAQENYEVWLAEDQATGERHVFKYCDQADLLASLRREVKISTLLRESVGDRPDIVRVLRWNFDRAPFYTESEWGGDDLAAWADEAGRLQAMPEAARLSLFLQIVDAIAAAHSVGVVHQDIKPSNILVWLNGEDWRVRLADFGSSRVLDPRLPARLGITPRYLTDASGATAASPMYAAPEMLEGGHVTLQSDVFALGILLYQLLVGRLRAPMPPGWAADIGDALLRDDIAAATQRALESRLDRVAEFGRRVRELAARRAAAEAEAATEQMQRRLAAMEARKRARRPWVFASIAGLGGAAFLLALYVVQLRQSERALSREVATERTLTDFLINNFIAEANYQKVGRTNMTVADAARAAAAQIDQAFAGRRPEIRATLHAAMESTFSNISDNDRAVAEADAALAALRGVPDPDWRLIATTQLTASMALLPLGRLADARARVESAEAAIAHLHPKPPDLEAFFLDMRAGIATMSLDLPRAVSGEEKAAQLSEPPADVPGWLRTHILLSLADAKRMSGRTPEAERIFRQVLEQQRRTFGPDDARTGFTEVVLASTLGGEGRVKEGLALLNHAAPVLTRALGTDSRRTVLAGLAMGELYFRDHQFTRAGESFLRVAASLAKAGRPSQLNLTTAQLNAAQSYWAAGDRARAETLLRQILDELKGDVPDSAPKAESVRFDLALLLLEEGKPAEAPALRRGLNADALREDEPIDYWPARLDFLDAWLAVKEGRLADARRLLETARKPIEAAKDELIPADVLSSVTQSAQADEAASGAR